MRPTSTDTLRPRPLAESRPRPRLVGSELAELWARRPHGLAACSVAIASAVADAAALAIGSVAVGGLVVGGLVVGGLAVGGLAVASPAGAAEIPVAAPATVDPSFTDARDVVLLDWDRDGDLDVLAASSTTSGVRLWRNQPPSWIERTFSIGTGPFNSLATGDLDGDGSVDFAYSRGDGSGNFDRIGVVLNRTSTFLVTVDSTTVVNPKAVAVGDVDADGDLDLVSGGWDGTVRWHENVDGDGETWTTRSVVAGFAAVNDLTLHDIDLDGDLDVVAVGFNRVGWIENRLDIMASWLSHEVEDDVDAAWSVAVGDVDGDGASEIVVGAINLNPLLAIWNRPAVLTDPWQRTTVQSVDRTADVELGDIDQDGDLDLVTTRWDGDLRYWQNVGNGFIEQPLGGDYNVLHSVAIGDLDGDGDSDFALAGGGSDVIDRLETLTIRSTTSYERLGSTNLAVPSSSSADPVHGASALPLAYDLIDFDRDGDLDLIGYDDDQRLRWRDTPGAAPVLLQATSAGLNDSRAFDLADVDGDGDQDVVLGLDQGFEWLGNLGVGSQFSRNTINSSNSIDDFEQVDWNRDGRPDFVAYDTFTEEIGYFRNPGTSSLFPRATVDSTISLYEHMTTGDLDGDGKKELIVASDGQVRTYEHIADIAYIQTVIAASSATRVLAADFDGDGDLDLCGYEPGAGLSSLVYWENDGSGVTWAQTRKSFPNGMRTLAARDLDLDGDLDVIGASSAGWAVAFGGTDSDGWPGQFVDLPASSSLMALGDLDRDGYLDGVGLDDAPELFEVRTLHGQFTVAPESAPGPPSGDEGTAVNLFELRVDHLGRVGDQAVELGAVQFGVRKDGVPLDAAQMARLFDRVLLLRVDGGPPRELAVVEAPAQASPLTLTVTAVGEAQIAAPLMVGQSSAALVRVVGELGFDAGDVGTFEVFLDGSPTEVTAQDEVGIPLEALPWQGASFAIDVLEAGLFADGFESGNLSAWSGSTP
ncbi:MAG: VCBS repeat-containing protein [Acidobacteriota bacterium]